MIEGEIKGRQEAQQLYEAAKDNGQKASLVEEERPTSSPTPSPISARMN